MLSNILKKIRIYLLINRWIFTLLFFASALSIKAFINPIDTVISNKSTFKRVIDVITKKRKFLLAPQFARSPQTGFLTGIYYLQLLKTKGDTTSRTSNVETFGSITQKQQYFLTFNNTLLFDHEKYFLRGNTTISKYNEFFYGIGNTINVQNRDLINLDYFNTLQRFTRRIRDHFYTGVQYQFNKTFNLNYDKGGILDASNAYGKNGSVTSGLGLVFLYDSRDHVIYSRTGLYIDASVMFDQKVLGSQYQFTNMTIDARKFIKFYKNDVLCFQGLINYNWGNVPFRQLALMGGDVMMRGYYPGTYRDNFMMATQVELRIPVWRIFGVVLFAALAEVEHTVNQFCWQDIKYTYGIGFRCMFIKHERVNVGGDIGFSKNTKTLGLGSGESF